MLAFGLYLQHVVGLVPCPMCIVQRYALILVAVCAGLAALSGINGLQKSFGALGLAAAVGGAWTAARQSWLQWYPPEVVSCGRDLYGMIETFPLKRALPMIFRGSGDCSKVDWDLARPVAGQLVFHCVRCAGDSGDRAARARQSRGKGAAEHARAGPRLTNSCYRGRVSNAA